MKKDFLHVDDWTLDEILAALDLAKEVKTKFLNRESYHPFKDHTLAMIFAKPSARTRVSFETGFARMGGHAIYLGPSDIDMGHREPPKDEPTPGRTNTGGCENPSQYSDSGSCSAAGCAWRQNPNIFTAVVYYCTYP